MRIANVRAGHIAKALERCQAAAGHSVSFSCSRSLRSLVARAGLLGAGAVVTSPRTDAGDADVVLLSNPMEVLDDLVAAMGGGYATEPLVITVSPSAADFRSNAANIERRIGDNSAAEQTARRAPSLKLIEAINLILADLLASDLCPFDHMTVLLCGDDPGAKQTASALIRDAGLDPIETGSRQCTRALEPMATASVQLAAAAGTFPFASLTRQFGPPGPPCFDHPTQEL